jgi:hypothetical protein
MTRRTNLALAAVLGIATATGVAALLVGEGHAGAVVWAHGAAGFALLALVRPKGRIAARGTARRGRRPRPGSCSAPSWAARWRSVSPTHPESGRSGR